jgi:hypothetical protein
MRREEVNVLIKADQQVSTQGPGRMNRSTNVRE